MIFTPKEIVVHHDGVSRKGASFEIVDAYHKTQHFPLSSLGFYVGYHFWIERDGTVRQARKEDEIGAHTLGQNYTALGIGLAGNFDKEMPTDEQVAALAALLSRLCFAHSIAYDHIFPHRHFNPKTCYGMLLSDTWAQQVFLEYEETRLGVALATLGGPLPVPIKKKVASLVARVVSSVRKV
jgi:hypothetical protein